MVDFKIRIEWEESPRSRVPELDATWARLQIDIGSESATRVEVTRSESIRSGIYVPLYPIAEWMIARGGAVGAFRGNGPDGWIRQIHPSVPAS